RPGGRGEEEGARAERGDRRAPEEEEGGDRVGEAGEPVRQAHEGRELADEPPPRGRAGERLRGGGRLPRHEEAEDTLRGNGAEQHPGRVVDQRRVRRAPRRDRGGRRSSLQRQRGGEEED
ncbi:hypothetical protein THAOC_10752, partial [Thalassiosira oceanica]